MDPTLEYGGEEPRSSFLQSPLVIAGAAFFIGLAIGWFAIGWGVWPLEWTDAAPSDLREDLREDYMRMVIDSYNLTQEEGLAEQRLNELGELAPEALARVAANPGSQSTETIQLFQSIVGEAGLPPGETPGETPATPAAGGTRSLLLVMCGLTFALAGILAAVFLFRSRRNRGEPSPAMMAQEMSRQAVQTDFVATGSEAPMSQWMTTYLLGDDLFDDSFSIDSAAGEFMGECGVGIADTIGVGEPKRVSAFEIWLFDKNDIQTVTKVLMSPYVFNDDVSRERLSAKGEPIVAVPGQEVVLETETLQLVARVVDMAYGEGAMPDDSYFDRITLELAVWSKMGAGQMMPS
jgi:hypothetical protein